MWLARIDGGRPPGSVTFDLGANYELSKVRVWNYFETGFLDRATKDVRISIATDAQDPSFVTLGQFEFPRETTGVGSDVPLAITNARLIRFDIDSAYGSNVWVGLSEVKFSGIAIDRITTTTETVPGHATPWLAGLPDGASAMDDDVAPGHSPVEVTGVPFDLGGTVWIRATGSVGRASGFDGKTPDGGQATFPGHGEQNGLSTISAPFESLLGVFLGRGEPDGSHPPEGLPFATAFERDFELLKPSLRQVFFIGDGLTGAGLAQAIEVPLGATRLFLAAMDSSEWNNNVGQFTVNIRHVSDEMEPSGSEGLEPILPIEAPMDPAEAFHPNGAGPIRWEVADGGNGHYYEFLAVQLTWADARIAVRDLVFQGNHGHLVNITSSEENDFVASILPVDTHSVWLGANDLLNEGTWVWADGPESGDLIGPFDGWGTNEPNNQNNEDVALLPGLKGGSLQRSQQLWYDGSAGWHTAVVVEYTPEARRDTGDEAIQTAELLTVTEQPKDALIEPGQSVRFEVRAAGESPLRFQWYFNGNPIPGARSRILEFQDVPFEQSGSYWSEIVDASGNLRLSETATLTVEDPLSAMRGTIASRITGRTIQGIHESILRFQPPPAESKQRRMGIVFQAGLDWTALGSSWEFDWHRDESGVQLIHPVRSGQCMITIHGDSIGISTPERWTEVGYGPGNERAVLRTALFGRFFPLVDGFRYRIKSHVSPDGSVSIFINRQLVARGLVTEPHPISFQIGEDEVYPGASSEGGGTFEGEDFPQLWGKGGAGLILEPVDRGLNEVEQATFSPGPDPMPVITVQPTDLVAKLGENVSLFVEVTASSPIGFQWFFEGQPIAGANSPILTLESVTAGQAGVYWLHVHSAAGFQVESERAQLQVITPIPPSITVPLRNTSVEWGADVRFEVGLNGTLPFDIVWRYQGKVLADQSSPALVLQAVTNSNEGVYTVLVRNRTGQEVSSSAVLTLLPPPPPQILQGPDAVVAEAGERVELRVETSGIGPIEHQWFFSDTAIEGATDSTLILEDLALEDDGLYWVQVNGPSGVSVLSEKAEVTVRAPEPPAIASDLENLEVSVGERVQLVIEATGSLPLQYQWVSDRGEIVGGTSKILVFEEVALADSGEYWVVVSNRHGEAMSSRATMSVTDPLAPPENDDFEQRFVLSGDSLSVMGSNVNATREAEEPPHGDFLGGRSVWWTWKAERNAVVTIETTGSEFDTLLAVYTGSRLGELTLVDKNDDAFGGVTSSRVFFETVGETDYQIVVDAFGESSGLVRLALQSTAVLPTIQVAISGPNILLSWGADGGGYQLEQTSRIGEAAWQLVETQPVVLGDAVVIKIPVSGAQQFYRLSEP